MRLRAWIDVYALGREGDPVLGTGDRVIGSVILAEEVVLRAQLRLGVAGEAVVLATPLLETVFAAVPEVHGRLLLFEPVLYIEPYR